METFKKCERVINLLAKIEFIISTLLLAALILVALLEVVSRYVFSKPFPWVLEVCTLFFSYIVFVGIPPMYRERRLVTIEFVFRRLPEKVQKTLPLYWEMLFGFFFVYLTIASYQFISIQMRYRSPALNIPFGYFTFPVLICSISMIIFNVYFIVDHLRGYLGKREGTVNS